MVRDHDFFGENRWVYCRQHLRPHTTGWCTVNVHEKTLLQATNGEDADAECREKGFELYSDLVKD